MESLRHDNVSPPAEAVVSENPTQGDAKPEVEATVKARQTEQITTVEQVGALEKSKEVPVATARASLKKEEQASPSLTDRLLKSASYWVKPKKKNVVEEIQPVQEKPQEVKANIPPGFVKGVNLEDECDEDTDTAILSLKEYLARSKPGGSKEGLGSVPKIEKILTPEQIITRNTFLLDVNAKKFLHAYRSVYERFDAKRLPLVLLLQDLYPEMSGTFSYVPVTHSLPPGVLASRCDVVVEDFKDLFKLTAQSVDLLSSDDAQHAFLHSFQLEHVKSDMAVQATILYLLAYPICEFTQYPQLTNKILTYMKHLRPVGDWLAFFNGTGEDFAYSPFWTYSLGKIVLKVPAEVDLELKATAVTRRIICNPSYAFYAANPAFRAFVIDNLPYIYLLREKFELGTVYRYEHPNGFSVYTARRYPLLDSFMSVNYIPYGYKVPDAASLTYKTTLRPWWKATKNFWNTIWGGLKSQMLWKVVTNFVLPTVLVVVMAMVAARIIGNLMEKALERKKTRKPLSRAEVSHALQEGKKTDAKTVLKEATGTITGFISATSLLNKFSPGTIEIPRWMYGLAAMTTYITVMLSAFGIITSDFVKDGLMALIDMIVPPRVNRIDHREANAQQAIDGPAPVESSPWVKVRKWFSIQSTWVQEAILFCILFIIVFATITVFNKVLEKIKLWHKQQKLEVPHYFLSSEEIAAEAAVMPLLPDEEPKEEQHARKIKGNYKNSRDKKYGEDRFTDRKADYVDNDYAADDRRQEEDEKESWKKQTVLKDDEELYDTGRTEEVLDEETGRTYDAPVFVIRKKSANAKPREFGPTSYYKPGLGSKDQNERFDDKKGFARQMKDTMPQKLILDPSHAFRSEKATRVQKIIDFVDPEHEALKQEDPKNWGLFHTDKADKTAKSRVIRRTTLESLANWLDEYSIVTIAVPNGLWYVRTQDPKFKAFCAEALKAGLTFMVNTRLPKGGKAARFENVKLEKDEESHVRVEPVQWEDIEFADKMSLQEIASILGLRPEVAALCEDTESGRSAFNNILSSQLEKKHSQKSFPEALSSVVQIKVRSGSSSTIGTGFFMDFPGESEHVALFTNRHVLFPYADEEAYPIFTLLSAGKELSVVLKKVMTYPPINDIEPDLIIAVISKTVMCEGKKQTLLPKKWQFEPFEFYNLPRDVFILTVGPSGRVVPVFTTTRATGVAPRVYLNACGLGPGHSGSPVFGIMGAGPQVSFLGCYSGTLGGIPIFYAAPKFLPIEIPNTLKPVLPASMAEIHEGKTIANKDFWNDVPFGDHACLLGVTDGWIKSPENKLFFKDDPHFQDILEKSFPTPSETYAPVRISKVVKNIAKFVEPHEFNPQPYAFDRAMEEFRNTYLVQLFREATVNRPFRVKSLPEFFAAISKEPYASKSPGKYFLDAGFTTKGEVAADVKARAYITDQVLRFITGMPFDYDIYMFHPKEEVRLTGKEPRAFCGGPLVLFAIEWMFCSDINDYFYQTDFAIKRSTAGLSEWDGGYEAWYSHIGPEKVIGSDAKNWDGSQERRISAPVFTSFYSHLPTHISLRDLNPEWPDIQIDVREILIRLSKRLFGPRMMLSPDGVLLLIADVMASGCFVTLIINTLNNIFMHIYAAVRYLLAIGKPLVYWPNYRFLCTGDDAIKDRNFIPADHLIESFKQLNIKIASKDEGVEWYQVGFCSKFPLPIPTSRGTRIAFRVNQDRLRCVLRTQKHRGNVPNSLLYYQKLLNLMPYLIWYDDLWNEATKAINIIKKYVMTNMPKTVEMSELAHAVLSGQVKSREECLMMYFETKHYLELSESKSGGLNTEPLLRTHLSMVKFHGNYCGPGHSNGRAQNSVNVFEDTPDEQCAMPVDELDRACAHHDADLANGATLQQQKIINAKLRSAAPYTLKGLMVKGAMTAVNALGYPVAKQPQSPIKTFKDSLSMESVAKLLHAKNRFDRHAHTVWKGKEVEKPHPTGPKTLDAAKALQEASNTLQHVEKVVKHVAGAKIEPTKTQKEFLSMGKKSLNIKKATVKKIESKIKGLKRREQKKKDRVKVVTAKRSKRPQKMVGVTSAMKSQKHGTYQTGTNAWHVDVPIDASGFIPGGSSTHKFKAGDVLAVIPLSVGSGVVPDNQFTTDTDYNSRLVDFGPVATEWGNQFQKAKFGPVKISFENGTAPGSTAATGRVGAAYIADPTMLGTLESGDNLIKTLAMSSGPKKNLHFGSCSVYDPSEKNTSIVFSPAKNFTPKEWLLTSPLPDLYDNNDVVNRCNGVILIFCEQPFEIGPEEVSFMMWVSAEIHFQEYMYQQRNSNFRILSRYHGGSLTANTSYGLFDTSGTKQALYLRSNPGDFRDIWGDDANATSDMPKGIDISKLCGPDESVTLSLTVNSDYVAWGTSNTLGFEWSDSVTVVAGAANTIFTSSCVRPAVYMEVQGTKSPCIIYPRIRSSTNSTVTFGDVLLTVSVNRIPFADGDLIQGKRARANLVDQNQAIVDLTAKFNKLAAMIAQTSSNLPLVDGVTFSPLRGKTEEEPFEVVQRVLPAGFDKLSPSQKKVLSEIWAEQKATT